MSHSTIDLLAHTAALIVTLTTAIRIDFSGLPTVAESLAAKERSLVVCGSAASGLLNLADVVSLSKPGNKLAYDSAHHRIQDRIHDWLTRQSIPNPDDGCTVGFEGKIFQAQPYRLDVIDAPERRVNWSFQINFSEEI